jgi:hypothetical protein
MGFFSLLETFFFISLAITFILIIMLVYHFKGRLVTLEDKCNTMFEIMNSMVKEMKNIRESMMTPAPPQPPAALPFAGASGLFPPELFKLFQGGPSMFPSQRNNVEDDEDEDDYEGDGDEDDDEDDEDQEYKKIVVSDTELDSDDDEEGNDVKIISVNIDDNIENTPVSLADLEEEVDLLDTLEIEEDEEDEDDEETETNELEEDEKKSGVDEDPIKLEISNEPTDYKKLDVSFLRTMVITRGLATDTKKMKKQDLIRLLEQSA